MAEHTPGPWAWFNAWPFKDGETKALALATLGFGTQVLSTEPDSADVTIHSKADAALIAAAPDLLEVARRVSWLLAQKRYPGIERDERTIAQEVDAAIAKARGTR